jgi:hypothetical protein
VAAGRDGCALDHPGLDLPAGDLPVRHRHELPRPDRHPPRPRWKAVATPPLLEDIAGAEHWDNMPDQGFTVHRPSVYKDGRIRTEAVMLHRKTRFEELGYPCKLNLEYEKISILSY